MTDHGQHDQGETPTPLQQYERAMKGLADALGQAIATLGPEVTRALEALGDDADGEYLTPAEMRALRAAGYRDAITALRDDARTVRATGRWRAEAPTERANITPDLGDLLEWLMSQGDRAELNEHIKWGSYITGWWAATEALRDRRRYLDWLAGRSLAEIAWGWQTHLAGYLEGVGPGQGQTGEEEARGGVVTHQPPDIEHVGPPGFVWPDIRIDPGLPEGRIVFVTPRGPECAQGCDHVHAIAYDTAPGPLRATQSGDDGAGQ